MKEAPPLTALASPSQKALHRAYRLSLFGMLVLPGFGSAWSALVFGRYLKLAAAEGRPTWTPRSALTVAFIVLGFVHFAFVLLLLKETMAAYDSLQNQLLELNSPQP